MIFVTVGTHEQQFNRLIKEIDILKEKGIIEEEVFIQSGYSDYKPKFCEFNAMISSEDMDKYAQMARIVITHGGPGSIMLPLKYNKIPIVVPRKYEFAEHVDNHQVEFANFLERDRRILAVYDINELLDTIVNYDKNIEEKQILQNKNNAFIFCKKLNRIVDELMKHN